MPTVTTDPLLAERLKAVIGRLEAQATERVGKRQTLEQRWLEDLEQYHGVYDEKTRKALQTDEKSKLFINETRPKTESMAARLMDLLFPTDDKNWGILPTPVPDLTNAAKQAASAAQQLAEQAVAAAEQGLDPAQAQADADAAKRAADELQVVLDEAKKRASLMEEEISDQLKESHYHAVMRDVIEDACKLGTGICKGPVTGDRVRKGWKKQEDGQYALEMSNGDTPSMRYVDPWSYFPDMDARNPQEGQGDFERHLMNKKKLRALARLPGFDQGAIRKLLETTPRGSVPAYLAQLRDINAASQQIVGDLYHVWEYSGPLDAEDLRDIALASGDMAAIGDVGELDPLAEVSVIIWFCQGELLKFAVYPFDSGECMYSVFNLAKDEASIFGYGIPAIMRDPQKSLNAAWRAMMDNAGFASGPQIVAARDMIEPADGDWTLKPRKVWWAKAGIPQDRRAFATFDIPMRQQELANIIALSKQFIDDMTSMPAIAQGEQGIGITKTAQGMALLMNSANVVFRRIVKNFDDDMTTPNIRRMYDWNMQFNPKEEIKGDYNVDARGSSVLLVREMQAQNLFNIALHLGAHPVYGPMLKNRAVLRMLFRAHMIPAEEVVLSDEEIDAVLQAAQANAGAQDLEMQKVEAQIELANMENDTKLQIAEIERETALIKMAETMNMSIDKLEAMLADRREERQSKERLFAAEVAFEAKAAADARRRNEPPQGSGGFISA